MFRPITSTLLLLLLLGSKPASFRAAPDELSPPVPREHLEARLRLVHRLAARRGPQLLGVLKQNLAPDERMAVEYLLAYAPLSDLGTVTGAYLLEQARCALRSRRETPWGPGIPADIFYPYVLPFRVNNEPPDSFRTRMFGELHKRIKGLNLRQAILEINHWCHEKVTYRSTDERTSAPLATMQTAYGRCGEESTFTVAALRTAGIPARQCYTPRWAHTDDNHAWVEAWVDGEWHYLGACEPEEALDRAWFDGPAKRAMLVHTLSYGPVPAPDPILFQRPTGLMLNRLPAYAPTRTLNVTIRNAQGLPLCGVDVFYQLYNYAEFFTLSQQVSDAGGKTRLTTGRGDLLVSASRGQSCGFLLIPGSDPREDWDLVLEHTPDQPLTLDLDLTPPPECELPAHEARDNPEHLRRLEEEDGLRAGIEQSFLTRSASDTLAHRLKLPPERLWPILKACRGNGAELTTFLNQTPPPLRSRALDLLEVISAKDLRDVPAQVLLAHLQETPTPTRQIWSDDLFVPFILNPRIGHEQVHPYRRLLRQALPLPLARKIQDNPLLLSDWVDQTIELVSSEMNPYLIPMPPRSVWSLRVADPPSRDIFAVALCRSLGIPARLEPIRHVPEAFINGRWQALWPQQRAEELASLQVTLPAPPPPGAGYFTHFTLGQWRSGRFETLDFPFGAPMDSFTQPFNLPAGTYRLVSGARLYNDDILAHLSTFTLSPGQHLNLPLVFRQAEEQIASRLALPQNLELELLPQATRTCLSVLAQPQGALLCFLRPGHEPSLHLLDDLARIKDQLTAGDGPVLLVLRERREQDALPPELLERLPARTRLTRIPADQKSFSARISPPFCALIDSHLNVVWEVEGYRVGSDAQLLRALPRPQTPQAAPSDREASP